MHSLQLERWFSAEIANTVIIHYGSDFTTELYIQYGYKFFTLKELERQDLDT